MNKAAIFRILIGAVAPTLIYYVGRRCGMGLEGAILASLWGLGVMAWFYWRLREIDGSSAMGAAYCIAGLVGMVIMRSEDGYLEAPIASDFLMGSVFLVSMLFRRPLIQALAEQLSEEGTFSEELRGSRFYRPLWLRLSLVWGGAYFFRGLCSWIALVATPIEVYLGVRVALDWPLTAALIAFSFWYPGRYWGRKFSMAQE